MIKKITLAVICIMVFAYGVVLAGERTFVNVPDSKIAIGGLTLKNCEPYVSQIYGPPTDRIEKRDTSGIPRLGFAETGFSIEYNYGNSFFIVCTKKYMGYSFVSDYDPDQAGIATIKVTANNGITTPSGIHVKSTIDNVVAAYGCEKIMNGDVVLLSASYKSMPLHSKACPSIILVIKNGVVTEMNMYNFGRYRLKTERDWYEKYTGTSYKMWEKERIRRWGEYVVK